MPPSVWVIMRLSEARELRDEIRADGLHCVVPLGYGPDNYYPEIQTASGSKTFVDRQAWLEYKEAPKRKGLSRPKNALDAMIDKACGISETDYDPA